MSHTVEHLPASAENPLLPIFGIQQKSELIDYCAGLTITSRDLLEVVLRSHAGSFEPYCYVCHVLDAVPDNLGLSLDDVRLVARAPSSQELTPAYRQALERVFLTVDNSKVFAAHMFYTSDLSYWYVLGFDRHLSSDVRGKSVYLITDHFGLSLDEVWAQVTVGKADFPRVPITFQQPA